MKTATWIVSSLALATTLIAAPIVWADGGGFHQRCKGHTMSQHGRHSWHGGGTSHLLRHLLRDKQDLGLTDEQITKLRNRALDADRARIRAEADVRVSERELRSLMWDDQVDMAAIEAKVKEEHAFEAAVRIIGIKAKRELLGILTPEQTTKWKALREERRSQHRGHMRAKADGNAIDGTRSGAGDRDVSELGIANVTNALSAG